jgi:hypothetical protein
LKVIEIWQLFAKIKQLRRKKWTLYVSVGFSGVFGDFRGFPLIFTNEAFPPARKHAVEKIQLRK